MTRQAPVPPCAARSQRSGRRWMVAGWSSTGTPWAWSAMDLPRAASLAGSPLRDSPEFDDWQSYQAELLRRELAGALDLQVRGHSARLAFEQAIARSRRGLGGAPFGEP